MVKLSWFSNVIHSHKSKKIIQQAGESMQNSYPVYSLDQEIKFPRVSTSSTVKKDKNESLENQTKQISDRSCCKTDDCCEESRELILEAQQDFVGQTNIRKSKSLGYIVGKERSSDYDDVVQEDELDKELSFHKIHQINNAGDSDLAESNKFEFQNISCVESTGHKSLFSIGVVEQCQSDGEHHDSADDESTDHVSCGQMPPKVQPLHARSSSVANLISINDGAPNLEFMGSHSRSCGNLFYINDEVALDRVTDALDARYMLHESDQDEQGSTCIQSQHVSNNDIECYELSDPEKDGKYAFKKSDCENQWVYSKGSNSDTEYQKKSFLTDCSVGYNDLDDQERDVKYWSEKEKCDDQSLTAYDPSNISVNEIESGEPGTATFCLNEGTVKDWDGSNHQDFNNRVAAWVSQLDVENCNTVEELGKSSNPISHKEPPKTAELAGSKKLDTRSSLGMVVAYNYLSTLSPTSSTALMANLGLIAIPSFNAFTGLKMLNLSGNAIVRITAGALPKGLHMLNLSKNHISVIEGLRELTRLRVLDLSYNKISKIGHGLASCSMLKELYMAGNKISEIDGLYRLLKLSILDLRCNRISNSKGVGQLAANYASLQAVNLEGNPAQRNVGDEQLKKYLLSLLPHLSYYNKHVVRPSGSKEVSDRPSRSFSSQQFDRSFRSGNRGTSHRASSSYGHMKNAMNSSIKSSRSSKYRPLPHVPPKPSNHLPSAARNLDGLQPRTSLRRIRSESSFSMI